MKPIKTLTVLSLILVAATCSYVSAETRVTYKAAKTSSSYYQMAVQIAEAIKTGTNGDIIITVEESQGSVQNVKEVQGRSGNYVFTTPPALIQAAQAAQGQFANDKTEKYQAARALFPIPSLTMHYVVRSDSGINSFDDLAGKTVLIGKGTYGAREAASCLKMLGLEDKIEVANVELGNAVPALKNKKIDAFATSGSFPAPNVVEAAAGIGIRRLPLSDEQIAKANRSKIEIPAGTYPGVDYPVGTNALPVIAYATTEMDDNTAYQITKTFWEQKAKMSQLTSWWQGVTPELLSNVKGKMHPGALRYYEENGITVPDTAK